MFRVGIVGLSSVGRFLLERLTVQTDCEIVLFQSRDVPMDSQAQSLGWKTTTDWPGFLSQSGLSTVLFLDGITLSLSQLEEAFQARLPVGLLPPLALEPDQWRELTQDPNRHWRILNPHHEDPDFRAALACIQSGELGPLHSMKRISWVGELVVPEGGRAIALDEWLPRLLWEDVDQLLHLAGHPPQSLYAVEFSTDPAGYFVVFKFSGGLTAHLERRRGLGIPLEIGWTIGSMNGGYSNSHRHIKTADGEIYDVPVELPPLANNPLMPPLESPSPSTGGENASRHVGRILELLSAIRHSARTGEVVEVHGSEV